MHKLAEGCCSAVTPCSWQQKNPSTICGTCRAASPSVSAWLEGERRESWDKAAEYDKGTMSEQWHKAQHAAYERAHAYAVARPDREPATKLVACGPTITDADLAYLASLAISSKDPTLARIAAALLLAR